jgi:hypothetical protein
VRLVGFLDDDGGLDALIEEAETVHGLAVDRTRELVEAGLLAAAFTAKPSWLV